MKKLWIKRYLMAILVLISCHSMEAGWRDWLNLASWKSWFSSIRTRIGKLFYSSPESADITTKTATAAAAQAFQQRQITPEEQIVNTFLDTAKNFSSDLSHLYKNFNDTNFNTFITTHHDFIKQLTSINPTILTSLITALRAEIPWDYLLNIQTFKDHYKQIPRDTTIAISKQVAVEDRKFAKELDTWAQQGKRLVDAPSEMIQKLLDLYRKNQIKRIYLKLSTNKNNLAQAIKDKYKDVDVSWIINLN